MHRTTTLGFALALGILVPTGWHFLNASIEVDGKHLRPLQQTVEIDGVKIKLDVDRTIVMTGDTVVAKLVAESDVPKQVTVDLRVLHATNYSGERVERPWAAIDRETIKLTSAPGGGKPVTTSVRLGQRPRKLGLEDSFKIMVTAHGTLAPRREFLGADGEGDARDFEAMMADGKGAAIAIRGWSGNNFGMKIVARGKITADEQFKIAVTIKNTTGHDLGNVPYVHLTTEDALAAMGDDASSEPALAIEPIDKDDSTDEPDTLKAGKSMTREFIVTPHGKLPRTITFLAAAVQNPGLGPYGAGAMDAKTFAVTESATPSVASKE